MMNRMTREWAQILSAACVVQKKRCFMKLLQCIDGLLVGTRYLTWAIGIAGVIASVFLIAANLPVGISSAVVFAASLLLAVGVSLVLLPGRLAVGFLNGRLRYIVGAMALLAAVVIMGIVWFTNNGFPTVNLIFA